MRNNEISPRDKFKCIEKMVKSQLKKLNKLVEWNASFGDRMNQNIYPLREKYVKEEFNKLPVEELNRYKDGIRVNTLHKCGISHIRQLDGKSATQLANYNGIGVETAKKIIRNIELIKREIDSSYTLRMNPKERNKNTDAIVRDAYIFRTIGDGMASADEYLAIYESRYANRFKELSKQNSFINYMFADKEKKARIDAEDAAFFNEMCAEFAGPVALLIKTFEDAKSASINTCWDDYRRNAATYNTLIENVAYGRAIPDDSLRKSRYSLSTAQSIPEKILEQVEAYELDLGLMETQLRRYQTFGTKYILCQKRTLLGDEMGLGKTIQAIAAIAHLASQGKRRFLVVCPLSVMINWEREIEKHSKIEAIAIHGYNRDGEFEEWINSCKGVTSNCIVGITTYETLQKFDWRKLTSLDMLIVDEAHNIKNPNAFRTQAVLDMAHMSEYVLFMTGTPLENRLEEMKFLIKSLNPTIGNKINYTKTAGKLDDPEKFKTAISCVYLRRVREDVLRELPELIEKEDWLTMNEWEQAAYEETLEDTNFMAVRRISWNVDADKSSKAYKLLELCEEASLDERKVIVFSFFRETLEIVAGLLQNKCAGIITGSVPATERQRIIDEFTEDLPGMVLLCQVEAGGTGLNIQAASVVIFCEPQLKPSTENQAIARSYRMGQVNTVMVHRLLMTGTVDERIMEILRNKTAIFDTYADNSVIGTEDVIRNEKRAFIKIIEDERERLGINQREN